MNVLLAGPQSAGTSIISIVVSLAMHIILAGSMLAGLVMIVKMTFKSDLDFEDFIEDEEWTTESREERVTRHRNYDLERMLRGTAFATGILVVLGARAAGVSIPSILGDSVSLVTPVRFAVAGVAVPAGIGVLTAWFFTRALKKSAERAFRIMIFVGTLVLTLFIDVYAAAVGESGLAASTAFVPNIAFVVALGVYAFSRVDIPAKPIATRRKEGAAKDD